MDVTLGQIFLSEVVGTALLILLGGGVVANVVLAKTKGFNGGWLLINFGWGLAVYIGVLAAYLSGAHLNPAVTVGLITAGTTEFVEGVPVDFASTFTYFGGEMVGAFLGAVLAFVTYKQHFDASDDPAAKLAVFSTGPAIRSYAWNVITEAIGTFVLVFAVISFGRQGDTPGLAALGALPVALVVIAIGISLGGPTGYAINPARDLAPRIAHAILPIKGKGSSDWGYAWVPVVGPLLGGAIAGWASLALLPTI
ncbi:MIP/aquaporin family protein [Mycetocola zhadangensis]|uniref:Aquaporin family protein n=1 Tax=Mycetocola zhadangensis TaxID=1164595 RepID=A0A3L7IWF3_9MICO|nr:MIP/aquaporin family protein [Mycetocola zhadangensis]RLQ82554.1 aquaporin family protein [Mycetocola zhadangensis]GGF00336.1 glycerol transporter [Mycetocola zhadangensis]